VVSERLARAYWPDVSPLGQCLRRSVDEAACLQVVGVVADRRGTPPDTTRLAEWYVPLGSEAHPQGQNIWDERLLLTRHRGDAARLAREIDAIVQSLVPRLALVSTRPAADVLEPALRSWRLGSSLLSLFGVLAAVLAMVGIHGVTHRGLVARRQELGVRMALGATPRGIVRLVLGDVARTAATALAVAMLLAFALSGTVRHLLFATSPNDLTVRVLVAGTLLLSSALAALAPLRGALTLDPAVVLRAD
jgi:hypothetical protein